MNSGLNELKTMHVFSIRCPRFQLPIGCGPVNRMCLSRMHLKAHTRSKCESALKCLTAHTAERGIILTVQVLYRATIGDDQLAK